MKRTVLRILREQAKADPNIERAEQVYRWASHLTAETRYSQGTEDYYVTRDGRRLRFKLTHMEQGLVGVVGLQGVGKTSLLQVLAHAIGKHALFFRWTREWFENLDKMRLFPWHYLGEPKTMLETMEDASIHIFLSRFRYLFIDLPDYSKKNRGNMNKDLRDVEDLWKKLQEQKTPPILILGIQKEMFGGHFFFGKMDIVELSPLKPDEMLEAYKKKWETTEPFSEEALTLLVDLSRGIFRRFLKYIQKCIEETIMGKKDFPITADYVKEAITLDQLVKDMDLELSELFREKEQKTTAVKLLNCIREQPNVNQVKIAELLGVNTMAVSRLIGKLEAYGYVKRKRGLHDEWLISLAV